MVYYRVLTAAHSSFLYLCSNLLVSDCISFLPSEKKKTLENFQVHTAVCPHLLGKQLGAVPVIRGSPSSTRCMVVKSQWEFLNAWGNFWDTESLSLFVDGEGKIRYSGSLHPDNTLMR